MTTAIASTGEAQNITQARAALRSFDAAAAMFTDTAEAAKLHIADARNEAGALLAHADALEAELQGNKVDSGTRAEIDALREQARVLLARAERLERATVQVITEAEALRGKSMKALSGLNSRHSGVEEATQAAAEGGAEKDYYAG
jgi:type II secretory pathway predicted ATPase ExeA